MPACNHLIFGAGLIGSYLAGCFIQSGTKVSLVERKNAQESFANGFTLSDYEDNHHQSAQSPSFINANDNNSFDIVWLGVKCNSVKITIEELRPFINPSSIIICCQNGFGSEQSIIDAFPDNEVLCAVVGFNVAQINTGHWHRSTQGALVIEKNDTQSDRLNHLEKQISSDLLPVRLSSQIEAERWAKLQLNLANAVNALADIPIKQMLESRAYRLIIAQLMNELLEVTGALSLSLPKVSAVHGKTIPFLMRLPDFIFTRIAQKMLAIDPLARTSMWHDLNQKKQTEIDFINGAVSDKAKELNIKTPVNDHLIKLVKAVERGDEQVGFPAHELLTRLGLK